MNWLSAYGNLCTGIQCAEIVVSCIPRMLYWYCSKNCLCGLLIYSCICLAALFICDRNIFVLKPSSLLYLLLVFHCTSGKIHRQNLLSPGHSPTLLQLEGQDPCVNEQLMSSYPLRSNEVGGMIPGSDCECGNKVLFLHIVLADSLS